MSDAGPLQGRRIGVTAARKAEEQIGLLRRWGAEVLHAPSVDYLHNADDAQLRASTEALIGRPVDIVVITTGMGLRGWLDAADGWDLRPALMSALARAQVVARGPKAAGALRANGLRETYTPPSETDAGLIEHLLDADIAGKHIVLQSHGEPLPAMTEPLRAAGAEVTELLPYRWRIPTDTAPMHALLAELSAGTVHAVTFTSAPAALALLELGGAEALRETVVACVGSVTAKPLQALGINVIMPERARTAALLRTLADHLSA